MDRFSKLSVIVGYIGTHTGVIGITQPALYTLAYNEKALSKYLCSYNHHK